MPSGSVLTGLTQPAFADGLAVCCENNRIETLVSLIARE
jgi:malonate decarboxylase epsilon subunit